MGGCSKDEMRKFIEKTKWIYNIIFNNGFDHTFN